MYCYGHNSGKLSSSDNSGIKLSSFSMVMKLVVLYDEKIDFFLAKVSL